MYRKILCWLLTVPLSAPVALAAQPYDYPFVNPLQATVIGTPQAYQPDLPVEIPKKLLRLPIFTGREIPDLFWYRKGMNFSVVHQDHEAPLIFIIAGTGADFDSGKMIDMQRAFYQAGFHVISLPSPTHMNFIVSSSETAVPGDLREDAEDLYRAMALAWQMVRDDIEASEFYLTGYSLGGIQSAFVSRLDEERKLFNFKKVLMINPPVSLYTSITIFDRMLRENVPGGQENFNNWFRDVMESFAEINRELDLFKLSGDVLYTVYKKYPPTDEFLKALIGLTFRISAANMIFTADVMNGGGYIVPRGVELSPYASLTDYFIVAHRTEFADYFTEYFCPFYSERYKGLSEQELIARESLRSIEPYLRRSPKIGVIHNEDDIILASGDIEWLKEVLGDRARIYPNGGHCGNMAHYANVAAMVSFFTGEWGME